MLKEECNSRIVLKRKLVDYCILTVNETLSAAAGEVGGGGGGGQLSIQFQVKQLANGSQL